MTFKVGTTTVINASGQIDWARLINVPSIGDITNVTVENGTPGAGTAGGRGAWGYATLNTNFGGGPYTYNCYVESLSGGGASGAVTVTANRQVFNCNCACRC